MGLFDRVRSVFASPADRRLAAAEREAAAWATAPAPKLTAAAPSIDWLRDQPPAPARYTFAPGYSDHTYQNFSAPLHFEGFDLDAIRAACARHRQGYFYDTAALMVAVLGFYPVFAALQQAVAPIVALPAHVHGGERGLARLVAQEVEEQLVPRRGLLPSPYFPPTLRGTLAIYLRMLGFAVLQHVDGDPDPDTGIRLRYSRIWEPWAVQRLRTPRKAIAMTTEGPIEILNDGKFTLIEDTQEGHLYDAAILALGDDTFEGKITKEFRTSFLDFFGKPKLWAKLPANVPTEGVAGDKFLASVNTIYGPDGRGILPDGSDLKAVAISGEGSTAFHESIIDAVIAIFMVLTGSAGTIGSGAPTGAGPYQPAKGGAWNVRHDLIARPTLAIVRGVNQGHVAPYCDGNYAEGIERAKARNAWTYPAYTIPFAAPDRDDRLDADIKRRDAYLGQLRAERELGAVVDQEHANKLADQYEVRPVLFKRDELPPAEEQGSDEAAPKSEPSAPTAAAMVEYFSTITAARAAGFKVDDTYAARLAEDLGLPEPPQLTLATAGEIYAYDIDAPDVTINEVRKRKGEAAVEWGNITAPEAKIRIAAGWTTSAKGWTPPAKTTEAAPAPAEEQENNGPTTQRSARGDEQR